MSKCIANARSTIALSYGKGGRLTSLFQRWDAERFGSKFSSACCAGLLYWLLLEFCILSVCRSYDPGRVGLWGVD